MRKFLGLLSTIVLVTAGPPAASAQEINEPELTGPLKLGAFTYALKCSSCHGKKAQGTGKGPPFLSPIYEPNHHPDQSFYRAVRNGVRSHHWKFGNMPPVDGITDQQIDLIVQYVRAMQRANGVY